MLKIIYLVLVFHHAGTRGQSMATVQVPQANMEQCQINSKAYKNDPLVVRSYCIVGVK